MDANKRKSMQVKKSSSRIKYSLDSRQSERTEGKTLTFPGDKKPTESPSTSLKDEEGSLTLGSTESLIFNDSKVVKVVDIYGVRVHPSVVKFENTFENQSYTEVVSVQNISENSVTVRIYNPRAWSFRVTPLDRGYLLAPGLKVTRRLHYTCTKNGIVHSTLPIYVNENIFELPLRAYKGQAFVEIIPTTINFGRVDFGCKPVERRILIKNVSFCATKFLVDVGSNELDLHVGPVKGWIRPHSSVTIVLQLLALREGLHSTELWITTDLSQARIHVEAEACRRNFMVIHPNTISDFTLVDFPVTFYGCRRYQTVVVCNMAASSSAFVVLADFGIKGQEPFREAKRGTNPHVKMFDVEPVEGRIRPFEERIFTFWFNPTFIKGSDESVRLKSDSDGDVIDYLCAVRIKRIQVDDYDKDPDIRENENTGALKDNTTIGIGNKPSEVNLDIGIDKEVEEQEELVNGALLEDISVLLYLYGEVEVPSLSVMPDSLHFPHTPVGTTVIKVVQLTNNTSLPLAFQYNKIPFIEVLPDFNKIAPKTNYDVTVKLCARNIGVLKRNIVFDILAQENATDKQDFHVVNQVTVKLFGEVKSQKTVPEPKFNPGITPLITNEVGFLTNEVTFSSKIEKPRGAMTAMARRGRPWHRTDALIAFPNDRPLTLRPRSSDKMAKTIYKGMSRYIAPIDESLTYTLEKLIKKKSHDDWFQKYIRGTAALSISKERCCKWKDPKPDPDPPVVILYEKEAKLPREVFVPLTFVQLYRIRVYPPLISFGSVTTSKSCTQILSIENANSFKISARIMPLTSGIHIQTLENFVISENSEAKVVLTFQRETLGRYSGTITCIINGFHSFDIAVVAEVVHRSLTITPEDVEIKIPELPFANTFFPVAINNPLNIPVTFSWVVPEESPIKIEPIIGVTPKRGTVWCVVFFEPENPNYKLHPIKLVVDGTVCLKLKTGVILPKTNVYFLEPVLNVGNVPMNLTTVRRFLIFNPDFSDAMFVVLNKEPVKGVKVKPSSGTIRAKSCHSLSLNITVSSEKALDFTVYMTLQNSASIEMRVTGNVVYPEIEVTPRYISLHRVPCSSVTRTSLTAENKSKAMAEIGFEMDDYPQFKISLSKRHHDQGLTSRGFTLEPGATQKFYLHFIPKDLASYEFYLPIVINNLVTLRGSTNKELEAQGRLIKGTVRHISFNERRTSSIGETAMSHLVLVDVIVLKASLVVSESELIFSSTSETKSFTVRNTSEQPIGVIIRSEDFPNNFECRIDREEAVKDRSSFKLYLHPGEALTYTVTFTATSPSLHVSDVSIFTIFEDQAFVYNTVRLTGSIPLPCVITPSVNEVYFQPVPLNVEVSFLFHLSVSHNQPNRETAISYEMSGFMDLFKVDFPKGNSVAGVTTCSIPVKITFQSSFPVSIRKQINFRGGRNYECYVTLIATADNCILTTHAFLKAHIPYQPRLNVLEEVTEKLTMMGSELTSPPKPQLMRQNTVVTQDSSSGSSNKSFLSLSTICSLSQSSKTKKSIFSFQNKRPSRTNTAEKEQFNLTTSDAELSFHLSEKEEKQEKSTKESLTVSELITKEGEELIFPMFPVDQAGNENAVHMNQTRGSIQQWVYEQVFCCSYNPFLGSHAFSSFSFVNKKDYGATSPVALRNVFDCLERICGRRIRRYFTPIDKLPEESTAKAMFTYNLYRQLVEFMEAQGALMAHVEPKYLMVYEEYLTYHKTIYTSKASYELSGSPSADNDGSSELMTAEKFYSISVQCWLDLFLQMFKTLVLGPTVGISYCVSHESSSRRPTLQNPDSEGKKCLYGRAEEILLSWLTHQYNSQRMVVWPNTPPPPRTVTNFDMDLEDGLVLTATTAAYCPYLNQIHFLDMCLQPTTISQAYHNTTCLCMAWDSIKLGFSVSPRDFVHPNTIKMLLLVTHLYRILPSYKPEATITFRATLNASESQIVMLENNEEATITYHVEILPHSANFFLEDCQNSYVLKRKSKGQVTVKYMARNANKAEAILLLCGACMPPKFGRNYVFKLEGYPVKLPVSASYNIISPQNVPLDTQITVESPHKLDFKADESHSYELWISYTEPQPGNLNALCWAKDRMRKIPRRLHFVTNTLTVTGNKKKTGSGVLAFKVCCFSQIVVHIWLIFRNPEIGDFIVKLQVTPQRPEPTMCLQVTINEDASCGCTNERTFNCNRCSTVHVPCRNLEQWSAVRMMFELTTSPAEKEFWATYIESNIGFRLLQWMLEEKREKLHEELELLFKKSKSYKVTCSSKHISCMPTLHVPDVRSKSSLPVKLHFDEATPNHSTVLHLTSIDGHEIRSYHLQVVIINNKKPL